MPRAPAVAVNDTAAALLGLLHDGPRSGGELMAAAADRFGAVFSLTRSQVYRELPALAEAGLLRPGRTGPRAAQRYRITAAGKRSFATWLAAGGDADAVRSPMVLRLLHAGTLPATQRAALVESGRRAYTARLSDARAAAGAAAEPHERAVAEFAVAHTRAMLRLLDAIPVE